MKDEKPSLQIITGGKGAGRPKQPLEKRKVLSDKPHHNRKGEPDLPMGESLDMSTLPYRPPIGMTKYEKECWNRITKSQRDMKKGAWIYRSDCAYLLATCGLYGRWREVRDQLNELYESGLGFVDDTGKASPLLNIEANLASKYQASLSALGMVPTRRVLVPVKEDKPVGDEGLLNMG